MSLIERNSEAFDDDSSTAPKPVSALARSLRKLSVSLTSLGNRRSSRLNGSTAGGDASVGSRSSHGNHSSLPDLLSTPATALLRAQSSILTLDPDTTVGEALSALASRRVLSAPVRTLEAAARRRGGSALRPPEGTTREFALASARATSLGLDFVCFVDVRDVLMSFLEVVPKGKLDGAKLLTRAKVLEEAGSELESMPLSSLPVIGSDGAFVLETGGDGGGEVLSADAMTLGSLLRDFLVCPPSSSAPAGGAAVGVSVVRQGEFPRAKSVAHRVALLSSRGDGGDDEQTVTHIVSQLDAARFVLQRASCLGPLALKTASELGWAGGKVVTVGPTAPAVEALAAMRRAGVSGLAVVEGGPSTSSASAPSPSNGGAMIGSFAVPDLRALVCEHLGSLALPVGEALAKSKGREFCSWKSGAPSGTATPVGGSSSAVSVPSPFSTTPPSSSLSSSSAVLGTSPRDAAAAAAAARRASIGGRVGQALATASPSDTFSAVLARLVARRVHRLHVVDDETTEPVGVVTLTDVLAAVLEASEAAERGDAAKAALAS